MVTAMHNTQYVLSVKFGDFFLKKGHIVKILSSFRDS